MKNTQATILISFNLFIFLWPALGLSQAHLQDASNSPQDWENTFNSITHVISAEKILLSYIETCKDEPSLQPRIIKEKEIWYQKNKQYVDASKWAVDYYGFTIEQISGKSESMKFTKTIDVDSGKVASELITKINDASKFLKKEELCSNFFNPASAFFSEDISIHKVFKKYIIKIRNMHQEYLDAMAKL